MINKETILSYANDNLTLLEWLKKTNEALKAGVIKGFEYVSETETTGHLKLIFEDNSSIETNTITLPKGPKGDAGATPNITIGSTTTLPAGSDATASITGTPENPVLNLGIPKGADGTGTGAQLYMHELVFYNKNTEFVGATALIISAQQEPFTLVSLFNYLTGGQWIAASGYWYKSHTDQGTVVGITRPDDAVPAFSVHIIDPNDHSTRVIDQITDSELGVYDYVATIN